MCRKTVRFLRCKLDNDDVSIGGALLAMSGGALAGGLGGAAGMLTGDAMFACVLGAGIIPLFAKTVPVPFMYS